MGHFLNVVPGPFSSVSYRQSVSLLSFFPRSGSRKKVAGGKSALTGLPAVIAYVRELLFLLYCPFEGVERAAYGYRIVIDHQKSGVFQKVVVTAQETALGISVLQGYHFIGLRQNGVVTLLVGLGVFPNVRRVCGLLRTDFLCKKRK